MHKCIMARIVSVEDEYFFAALSHLIVINQADKEIKLAVDCSAK